MFKAKVFALLMCLSVPLSAHATDRWGLTPFDYFPTVCATVTPPILAANYSGIEIEVPSTIRAVVVRYIDHVTNTFSPLVTAASVFDGIAVNVTVLHVAGDTTKYTQRATLREGYGTVAPSGDGYLLCQFTASTAPTNCWMGYASGGKGWYVPAGKFFTLQNRTANSNASFSVCWTEIPKLPSGD